MPIRQARRDGIMQPMTPDALQHSHLSAQVLRGAAARASATVEARGLRGDRRWMIVDADGRFVTARKHPRLVLIRARFDGTGLVLDAPDMPSLAPRRRRRSGSRIGATIWSDRVDAVAAEPRPTPGSAAISDSPRASCTWTRMHRGRSIPAYSRSGDEVSFADGFPLLLISAGRARRAQRASWPRRCRCSRFRPNLVVAGMPAHAEDGWRSIRIGEVEFDVVKPCTRCVLTTVDPAARRVRSGRRTPAHADRLSAHAARGHLRPEPDSARFRRHRVSAMRRNPRCAERSGCALEHVLYSCRLGSGIFPAVARSPDDLRPCDRRRRLRRLRARQPAQRRSGPARAPARSRRTRLASVHPHAGRYRQAGRQSAAQLELQHRARTAPRRAPAVVAARQGARRLELDQRDVLHPRRRAATTTTGRRRPAMRAGPGTTCSRYFKRSEGNTRGADALHGADGPLGVSDLRHRNPLSRDVHRVRRGGGLSAQRRFQRSTSSRASASTRSPRRTARAARRRRRSCARRADAPT